MLIEYVDRVVLRLHFDLRFAHQLACLLHLEQIIKKLRLALETRCLCTGMSAGGRRAHL